MASLKRLGLAFCAFALAMPVTPAFASPDNPFDETVTFVSSDKEVVVHFTSPDQTLDFTDGDGHQADSSDKGGGQSKQYFICWSNIPKYSGDKKQLEQGAKGFYTHEPIKNIFPDGIPANAKIYASYLDAAKVMLLSGSMLTGDISINKSVPVEDTMYKKLPSVTQDDSDKSKQSFYAADKMDEKMSIKLGADFSMNPFVSAVCGWSPAHFFKPGSAQYYGAWGNDQTNPAKDAYAGKDGDKKAAYTYVDLHVQLDDRIDLSDSVTFDFKSYAFQPRMILTKDYQKLDSTINTVPNNPVSKISFKPNGIHEFIVRTVLRSTNDFPGISYETANRTSQQLIMEVAGTFTVSKENIVKIADKSAAPLKIAGHIDGGALFAEVKKFIFTFGGPSPIPATVAEPIYIDYQFIPVNFNKNTSKLNDSSEQNLGLVNTVYGGSIQNDFLNTALKPTAEAAGDSMPENPSFDGYTFMGWATTPDATTPDFTGATPVTEPITVYAVWKKNVPPAPATPDHIVPATPEKPSLGKPEANQDGIPETGETTGNLMLILSGLAVSSLLCAIALYAFKKRSQR